MSPFTVVIGGGGIAGVEGLLRLRRLAGDQLDVTLLSPDSELVYRPLAVLEPFAKGAARRYPIDRIVADTNARWVRDTVGWVDRTDHVVHTGGGQSVPYDALLLAMGGQRRVRIEHAEVFTGDRSDTRFSGLVHDVEEGTINSLAFVLPSGRTWPLPLYELALMTAQRAHERKRHPDITFITPEPRPLYPFGGPAGDAVADLLRKADITLHSSSTVDA